MNDKKQSTAPKELRLECGQAIHIQPMNQAENTRQQVKLIGWETSKSIIVKPPNISSWILLLPMKASLLSRLFSGSSAYGFETSILCIHHHPFDYLHLEYPTNFKSSQIRQAPRVKVDMEATLNTMDKKVTAVKVIDVSRTGMAIVGPVNLTKVGEQLTMSFEMNANKKNHTLSEVVVVRNSRTSPGNSSEIIYGIEFLQLDDEKTLIISGFLYELQG